jgi:hypothetical protein
MIYSQGNTKVVLNENIALAIRIHYQHLRLQISNPRQFEKFSLQIAKSESFVKIMEQWNCQGDGFILKNPERNVWAIFLKDASHQGNFRYQEFTEDHLLQHYSYATKEIAVTAALLDGYSDTIYPGLILDECISPKPRTLKFAECA